MSGLKEAVAEALLLEQQTIEEISKTYEIQPEGYAILKSGDKFMVVKMDEDRVTKALKTFNEKERKPTTNISPVPIYKLHPPKKPTGSHKKINNSKPDRAHNFGRYASSIVSL